MMRSLVLILFVCHSFFLNAQQDSSRFWFKNYEFEKAISFLESKKVKDASEFHILAQSYKNLGQTIEAYSAFEKAVQLDSLNITYLNHLAEIQFKVGEEYFAYKNYQKLIQLKPNNPFYYKRIGKVLNSASASQIYYELLIELNHGVYPKDDDLRSQLVKTVFESNHITSATSAYEKAIELNPKDAESKLILIKLYLKNNFIDAADILCKESMSLHPENSGFIMLSIKIAYRLRDAEDVVVKSNLFYEVSDSSLVVQKLEGIAHFQLGNYNKCIQLLENVTAVDKTSEILHYYLGLAYHELGQLNNASDYLEKAVDLGITENIENYYTRLAVVYEELGNYEKSIQLYKAAYSKSKDKILLYHLARNYDVFYKDKSTALKYYKLYIQENDTANEEYFDFSKSRINELKVVKHFTLDSIN